MTGAAAFVASAAYRSGAGMVRLGVPGAALSEAPASEAVSVELPATGWAGDALEVAERCAAVVVGPGLGRAEGTAAEVAALVAESPVPVVVDADGLFALGRLDGGRLARAARRSCSPPTTASTPGWSATHRDRIGSPQPAGWPTPAARWPCSRGRPPPWPTPEAGSCWDGRARRGWPPPAPATSCPGMIGAMMARGVSPLEAAALAAHVHGRAARRGRARAWWPGTCPSWWPPSCPTLARGEAGRPGAWPERPSTPSMTGGRVADGRPAERRRLTTGGRPGPTSTSTPCATTPACCAGWWPRPGSVPWSRPTATATVAVPVARAAVEGGATWLAVALVEEGVALRDAGIDVPVLLLSEPPVEAMAEAVGRRLVPTVYTRRPSTSWPRPLPAAAVGAVGGPVDVHLKVDTGMHRVGADPADDRGPGRRRGRRRPLAPGRGVDPPGRGRGHQPRRSRVHRAPARAVRRHPGHTGRRRPPSAAHPCGQLGRGHRLSPFTPGPRPVRHRRLRGGTGAGSGRSPGRGDRR